MRRTKAPAKAVLFDLLSALIDSWSLWDDIAGSEERGRRWRFEYLRLTYGTGAYVPYLDLVAQSAAAVGLPREHAVELEARWDELAPWPGAGAALRGLAGEMPIGVATNCSQVLGVRAAGLIGAPFRSVVTAESAGFYKPDPRMYEAGVEALGVPVDEVLFMAGSPRDIRGAVAAGLEVVWHNPAGLDGGGAEKLAVAVIDDLRRLDGVIESL
ncbi:MAG: HAD-IA family hydrolase [Gammaproteobacteria bacterium]|nr:HAD-IA family hydrolase [Gammaproteobacteria bacterium]